MVWEVCGHGSSNTMGKDSNLDSDEIAMAPGMDIEVPHGLYYYLTKTLVMWATEF